MKQTPSMMPDRATALFARASGANALHVFVYGTLRWGGSNDIARYDPAPRLIGEALIRGTLYDLGAYPGLRLCGHGSVAGEVYLIDRPVEALLDCLEGVRSDGTGEYVKRSIIVPLQGTALVCLVYEVQAARAAHGAVISSGDWMAHLNGLPPPNRCRRR